MSVEESLQAELDSAQSEYVAAQLSLIEAQADFARAQERASRLETAVAALKGELPAPQANIAPKKAPTAPNTPEIAPEAVEDLDMHLSPEEWEADRSKKRRQKEKEAIANSPYGNIKCMGCGTLGTMNEAMIQSPGGAAVRMLTCSGCGNQMMM